MNNELLQVVIFSAYFLSFLFLHSRVARWRKGHMKTLFNQLPERSRNLMLKEPWLSVPPPPTLRTEEDAAYRMAFYKTKWPGRFVWIGYLIVTPGFNRVLDKAFA